MTIPTPGPSYGLPLTRMWSGTAYFAILEATMVLSSSLTRSVSFICSFSTMKAKAPGRQMSKSHVSQISYWLARPGMLIQMLRQVSNHSYVQSRDCQENHKSCLQKRVRLQPSNDGPALSWHPWTRLISVTMTTQHKLPKSHWDQ